MGALHMRKWNLGWIGILAAALCGQAAADALPPAPHLVVRGQAEAEVRPDLFEVQLRVAKTGDSVPEVSRTVEKQTRQLVDGLLAAGLAETDIQATNMAIEAQFEHDDETGRRRFVGNRASRDITGRFASLKSLYDFLDTVPAGETIEVGGVLPKLSREAEIKSGLLDEAVADSKRAAEELAGRYGQKIVGVHSISDQPIAGRGYALDRIQVTGSRISRVLAEGVVNVRKDVHVVFLIGPR
ncbi:SIMPL domain-containing protein [Luteimonas sp. R10]|uniref:SIMPL domain-containing protein n=1 Tax=Luteimonas sp. R10 TaxID=3108176 RepID=UPI0030916CD3|nr:SIMPL domain-containing protein [Luteimonas sp. R10]